MGLDVELVPASPALTIQSVATGELQFGMSLPDPALFNALRHGIAIKIVASSMVNRPTSRTAVFMVRADLVDGGAYRSARDLTGATIGVPAKAAQFYVDRYLT